MALQVKRAGADEYGTWVKLLVVGDPGSGKTRMASTWPGVLYANCEGGMMSVADRAPACVDISSGAQVKELVAALAQPPKVIQKMLGVQVETVVLDTLDEIARIYTKERLDSERKETMAIQDWGWLGDQLRGTVRAFRNLDMNVIFNVHSKSQEDSESGRTYFKPAIPGAMGDELAAYVDLALLAVARPITRVVQGKNVREIARYLQTYPDAQHPWVKDRSGKLPMEFEINFDDDYQRLYKHIYESVPKASSTLASTGSVASTPPQAPQRTTGAAKVDPVEDLQALVRETAPTQVAAPPTVVATAPNPVEVIEPEAPAPVVAPEPVAPEPTVAPVTPEPAPTAPEPVVEAPVAAAAPAPEPEPQPVPEVLSEPVDPWRVCQGCQGEVESKDQADLSFIRHHEHLCRKCFGARKKTPSRR